MPVNATPSRSMHLGSPAACCSPADAEYEDARRVHNGLVDERPAIIARCRGVVDISDAVKLARALGWRSPSAAVGTTSQVEARFSWLRSRRAAGER